jgi:hypothetical protein
MRNLSQLANVFAADVVCQCLKQQFDSDDTKRVDIDGGGYSNLISVKRANLRNEQDAEKPNVMT